MLCPQCEYRLKRSDKLCPQCGADVAALRSLSLQEQGTSPQEQGASLPGQAVSLPKQEAPLSDDGMNTEWNGQTYTQYYREPPIELPPMRREGRRSSRPPSAVVASAGRSGPPVRMAPEPVIERPGRVYGVGDAPEGPVYVRKPPERPVRASVQRRVSLNRCGPRIGLILLIVLAVVGLGAGTAWYFLTTTQDGQLYLAERGWKGVPIEAFWRLGESKMREGYVAEAIDAFKKAYKDEKDKGDTPNVEGILALANAYERDGKMEDAIALYTDLMGTTSPNHPEAYVRMYRIYKDAGDHANAVAMLETGRDKTGQDSFNKLIHEYSPNAPYADPKGDRSEKEVYVTIKAVEGVTIKYTLDDRKPTKETVEAEEDLYDPVKYGKVYEGEEFFLGEGTTRIRAVAVQENGVPSKEMDETYTVVFPTPDAPTANVASGTYDYAPNVKITAKNDKWAIYYTVDNTVPTINSTRYTGPVKLPKGLCYLRAIAVDLRGKVSYEMNVEYDVKVPVKKSFNADDRFDKLVLMKTTYDQFVRAYGKPLKYEQIDIGSEDEKYRADYDFGYACFLQVEAAGKSVLYELMVESGGIVGPRKITIGSEQDKVIAAFRDMGGQERENGERLLYDNNLNSIGVYRLGEDGNYAAHYYYPRDKKNEFVEVAFYFQRDQVVRMHWVRYIGDK